MPTMEDMLAQAQNLENAQRAGAVSKALNVGLTAVTQVGGAMAAWHDARMFTGYEETDEVDSVITATAVGKLAQLDVGGFLVTLLRGRELQAEQRRKRQKEKKTLLQRDLRELKRGIYEHEKAADKGYGQRIAQADSEAQRYAFSLYADTSGVKNVNQRRQAAGFSARAEAEAEAPTLFLAEKLDRLGDARAILEREIDDSLISHPGRLKYEEQLQAAIDETLEL